MKKILVAAIALAACTAQAASVTYYGDRFHGRKTASGERFNQNALTCASNSHKFGTHLKVTNTANGKSVICRVNDRGGFNKYGVSLDLSKAAFAKIAPLGQGRAKVTITPVESSMLAADEQGGLEPSQFEPSQGNLAAEQIAKNDAFASQEPLKTVRTTRITLAGNLSATSE
ncbi:septal ring lytic transglycosylase RlpA family protein [Moraxella marmotae]|uniref:septal ring lytic transglycosylase RlpA family protein n=1 Tax=Moraxella marmotae TaxID=3344520 RepID=UPI0035D4E9B0